jgi:hypothetical protein
MNTDMFTLCDRAKRRKAHFFHNLPRFTVDASTAVVCVSNQSRCLLAGLAGAVDASGLLQVGRPGQPRKMFSTSMLDCKERGREKKAREEHSLKAHFPIVVSESGSVMDVSEEHS